MRVCHRKLRHVVSKLDLSKWLNTAEVVVEPVTTVRDWKSLSIDPEWVGREEMMMFSVFNCC